MERRWEEAEIIPSCAGVCLTLRESLYSTAGFYLRKKKSTQLELCCQWAAAQTIKLLAHVENCTSSAAASERGGEPSHRHCFNTFYSVYISIFNFKLFFLQAQCSILANFYLHVQKFWLSSANLLLKTPWPVLDFSL